MDGSSFLAILACLLTPAAAPPTPSYVIGYTAFRTDLKGGRHANVRTMRAVIVNLDTGKRRLLAEGLVRDPDSWTQFAGWSPDGRTAILGRGWQSQDNAKWEEERRQFRFVKEGRLLD